MQTTEISRLEEVEAGGARFLSQMQTSRTIHRHLIPSRNRVAPNSSPRWRLRDSAKILTTSWLSQEPSCSGTLSRRWISWGCLSVLILIVSALGSALFADARSAANTHPYESTRMGQAESPPPNLRTVQESPIRRESRPRTGALEVPAWERGLLTGREELFAEEYYVGPFSGLRYGIYKDFSEGLRLYCSENDGLCFKEVGDLVRAESRGMPEWALRMEPELLRRVASAHQSEKAGEVVNVIIELRDRTFVEVSSRIWKERSATLNALMANVAQRSPLQSRDDWAAAEGRRAILQQLDTLLDSTRKEIYGQAAQELMQSRTTVEGKIRNLGGSVLGFTPVLPALYAKVPLGLLRFLAALPPVERISENGLLEPSLDVSARAIYADTWWNAGYTGGIWDLAVVDTGIDGTHPSLAVDYASVFHAVAQGDPCYADDPSNPNDFYGHGTHIAGIVASTHSTYRGVAYGLDALINAKAGFRCSNGGAYMYWSDGMDAVDWAIQTAGADVVSLSFGGSPGAGDTAMGRFFDAVVDSLGIMVAVSAGNSGPGSGTVTAPGSAYNILSVGNMQDMNTVSRLDDSISSSSGRGLTGDGRLKPDIVAPGTNIVSTNYAWEGFFSPDFVSMSGTSMAAPHVAASVLLLMHERGKVQPAVYKALLLNTADDWGAAGPDSTYGWGYIDLWEAYFNRADVHQGSVSANPRTSLFYRGPIFAGEKATLVWNRHATYAGSDYPSEYYPLNDLDLYAYSEIDNSLVGSSVSSVNNVEQIVSSTDYSSIVYKVVPFGSFSGVTQEDYALAVEENIVPVSPPLLSPTMSPPGQVELGSTFSLTVTVSNNGQLAAHGVQVGLNLPSGLTLVMGANPRGVGSLAPGAISVMSWQVRADRTGTMLVSADASSASYGEPFSGTTGTQVLSVRDTTPPVSSVSALPALQGASIFSVTATASDLDAIAWVDLIYRRNGGLWSTYGRDASAPYSWSFDTSRTGGDGTYEFYSLATDASTNAEVKTPIAETTSAIDTTAPKTSSVLVGISGDNGWYLSSVIVSLSAGDNLSGVASTSCRVDGAPWQPYTTNLAVTSEGTHVVEFYSVDGAGNVESTRRAIIQVDMTSPSLQVADIRGIVTRSEVTLSWAGFDTTSGIAGYQISVDGEAFRSVGTATNVSISVSDGRHHVGVRATDVAGNDVTEFVSFAVDTNVFSPSGPYFGVPLYLALAAGVGLVVFLVRRWRRKNENHRRGSGGP